VVAGSVPAIGFWACPRGVKADQRSASARLGETAGKRWPAGNGVMRRPLAPPRAGRTPRTQEMRRT